MWKARRRSRMAASDVQHDTSGDIHAKQHVKLEKREGRKKPKKEVLSSGGFAIFVD